VQTRTRVFSRGNNSEKNLQSGKEAERKKDIGKKTLRTKLNVYLLSTSGEEKRGGKDRVLFVALRKGEERDKAGQLRPRGIKKKNRAIFKERKTNPKAKGSLRVVIEARTPPATDRERGIQRERGGKLGVPGSRAWAPKKNLPQPRDEEPKRT